MTQTYLAMPDAKRRIKAIFIGSMGNLVEWYDFYAYTAFALYFAPAFFPSHDPVVQQLNAATLFAAGFIVRPLGGWLFGHLADRHGRRLSLMVSVGMMCVGSLIIALTPTYATIGFAAPALLALARVVEGLSLGGEYGASATYLTEIADPEHRGFYSSFQYVTLIGGQLCAILVLLLLQNVFLTHEELVQWGWRIPFVIGALLAIVTALMRRDMPETDSYKAAQEAQKAKPRTSSLRGLTKYPREVAIVVGLTAGGTAAFYTFTTYMQTFVRQTAGFTDITTTYIIAGSLIFALILQPLYGALSDKVGRKPLLIFFGVAGAALTVPILMTLSHTRSPFIAFLLICGAWVHGGLHIDQRRREGGIVSHQHPRHGRGRALRHHRVDLRRHGAGHRAVLQAARPRAMVLLLLGGRDLRVPAGVCLDARHQASIRHAPPRLTSGKFPITAGLTPAFFRADT